MRNVCAAALIIATAVLAQKPADPRLLIPTQAPAMNVVAVPNPLPLPPGIDLGAPAASAYDSHGHHIVLFRGRYAFAEFDGNEKFIRVFGEGLFTRAHGLKIDKDDNMWAGDVTDSFVVKVNPQGQVLMIIGTKGKPGEWNEATGSHLLNEPNDFAIGRNGDVFVVQGHSFGKGDPRVLKFDKNGKFIKTWGGIGTEPGKFVVAHGISIDAHGLLWIADRENQRIQVFAQDGKFIRQMQYVGLPCNMVIGKRFVYMANGFTGQLLRLDLNGKVLAAAGKVGTGVGEFEEAHSVAVSPKGEIWVADTIRGAIQKFVKK